jgi:predicted TIM-barrel fold metal-dependent hydrolase
MHVLDAGAVPDGSGGDEWCGIGRVTRLLERFPELRLVIAHLGAPDYEDFIALASSTPTVMLDTAMVFGGDAMLTEVQAWLVDKLGGLAGQIVFGSDFPTIPRPVSAQLAAIDGLGFGDEWLSAVLWRNGVRLLGIAVPDW